MYVYPYQTAVHLHSELNTGEAVFNRKSRIDQEWKKHLCVRRFRGNLKEIVQL